MKTTKLEKTIDERINALEKLKQTYYVRDVIKTLTMAKFAIGGGGSVARNDAEAVLESTAWLITKQPNQTKQR